MTISQAKIVLGLSENFTAEELKAQYRKKVLIAHPDRNGGDEKKFLLVQRAFDLLSSYKDNSTVYRQSSKKQHPNANDIYQKRRQAEQAYKEKVHYYYRQKSRVKEKQSRFEEFTTNLRYFFITILIFIAFFILLITAMVLGAFGVITFLIIASVFMYRLDFRKIKF